VNPGRAPTRLGGDGILPFVEVPHWFLADVVRVLRRHRVEHTVELRVSYMADYPDDPDCSTDRISFPTARPAQVQPLLDSIKPDRCE
jgi:hypothetical protein